jgi:undecaprenyl-diphosphatase
MQGSDERLAWLIVIATVPVGLTGLILEHTFRTLFAKPVAASVFLLVNGIILLRGEGIARSAEQLRARAARRDPQASRTREVMPIGGGSPELDVQIEARAGDQSGARSAQEIAAAYASDVRISRIPFSDSIRIGLLQILALFAGISRDGVTMVGGLWRGLDREDAARFAFLLATPPILAAGVLKLPSLTGSAGAHIHGQVAVGFVITAITAYLSVRYLVRYFRTGRSLTPFGLYCLAAGLISTIRFAAF